MITDEVADLLRKEILLKAELSLVKKQLADFRLETKKTMRESGQKRIEENGLRVTYTPPREYEDFSNKKVAMKVLKDQGRNDLVVKKTGYERLTISVSKGD